VSMSWAALGLVAFAGISHAPAEQRIGDAGVEPQCGVVIGDGTIKIAGPQIGIAPAIENHRGVAGVNSSDLSQSGTARQTSPMTA